MLSSFFIAAFLSGLPDTPGVRVVRIISGIGALVVVGFILFRRQREEPLRPSGEYRRVGNRPGEEARRSSGTS